MFRRKKGNQTDHVPAEESPEDLLGALGFDVGFDDPYHMAHYRFAFIVVPMWLFGEDSADFIRMLVTHNGRAAFGALWFSINSQFDIDQDAFEVEARRSINSDWYFVVNMPRPTGSPNEALFFGIFVPKRVVDCLEDDSVDTSGVRLIYLESSMLGLTVVGESRGPGDHLNLGSGPEPSRTDMWVVMEAVFSNGSSSSANGSSIGWEYGR